MINSRCCSQVLHVTQGVLAVNSNLGRVVTGIANRLYYSKDKGGKCGENIPQTTGRKVEPWPKPDPSPPVWRCECPHEPQPPNYDPYRIKVPEVVVPPLPPSNAKPMLDCAKTKGPCSPKLVPDPPPCPPPPPKPFPWIYVWAVFAFFSTFGVLYRLYIWKEERDRLDDSKPIWRPRRKVKRPYHDKDLPACVQYLIVGTGAAGWAAYRAIMQHDKTAKVFFVTKEDILPYRRPPMTKWMWWNPDPPELKRLNFVDYGGRRRTMYQSECRNFMDPVKFYRKKKGPATSIASGWCVLRVDADDHVAYVRTMCGEQPIYYERCLLAPGSKAKTLDMFKSAPKEVRQRVTNLRTIRDLEIAYRKVKAARHVVIIGGGTLGTELAYHLGRMNKVVERLEDPDPGPIEFVHIYKDKGLMAGILPEYLGEWAAEKVRCQGVTLMPKTQVYDAFISADGRLELTLSNGKSIVTDYAFVAIGAEPRTEIADPSFLETDEENGGFLVNTELKARTHLYVAGDAASFWSQWKKTRTRMEHYDNAVEQGHIAGANMTGYWTPCNMEPHYDMQLHDDLYFEVIGEVGACMPTVGLFKECEVDKIFFKDHEAEQGDANRVCYKQGGEYEARYRHGILFYLREETVVGFLFWNMKETIEDRLEVATELLRARPSYKDIDLLAELLGFKESSCVYKRLKEEVTPWPCFKEGIKRH
ncbi:apoptosis-inducing factor 1, mitochondrial-like [Anticarsia gemmatalis]|uniref:apoptosis-inducing factor 1, mitochondrial-like n=1 Tax=Anticarsia gemmatalis TaxID=129554 RepID=UPI003F758109